MGIDSLVITPNYGSNQFETYYYDSIRVVRYPETSILDRDLIMGKRKTEGLAAFNQVLEDERPDVIHFHEIAAGNGITHHHVKIAKSCQSRIVVTFHLSGNSCRTGTMMYKGRTPCNGKINELKCSSCYLHAKGYAAVSSLLVPISTGLDRIGIDTTIWNNKLGTALATSRLIRQFSEQLHDLENDADALVVLTDWYKKVLLLNDIESRKIHLIPQALPVRDEISRLLTKRESSSSLRLMFLGRISPYKGLHVLLRAIRAFKVSEVTLDIYGQSNDHVYENECRSIADGMQNIRWMGLLPKQQVVATMRLYDALCLCSTFSEMSPLVIQEAFAAGIPVIASNAHGNTEQIKHSVNGLIFKMNDVESLRKQLELCIQNHKMIERLSAAVAPPDDFSVVGKAYYNLYKNLQV